MKLMLCGDCGDVVSPGMQDLRPRWCECGRHGVWWRDGAKGLLSVHDKLFPGRNGGSGGKAWVIGLHNRLLLDGGLLCNTGSVDVDNSVTRADRVEVMINETPDSYLFKRARSLAVRFAPGVTGDTRWDSEVPT